VVTHNPSLGDQMEKRYRLDGGKLEAY